LQKHRASLAAARQVTVYKEGQQLVPGDVDWSYATPRASMRRGVINLFAPSPSNDSFLGSRAAA
jgi:hypothetical protein